MGEIKERDPVKFITGFIFKQGTVLCRTKEILEVKFGKIDFQSQIIPFTHTDYYEKEMGRELKRQFISFSRLIAPDALAKTKIYTNKIEKKLSLQGRRSINIDCGYLGLCKLVLASTKDYTHRIYLKGRIYAEVTLFYQNKTFNFWEWTYPDYRTDEYIAIFSQIREIYAGQIRKN